METKPVLSQEAVVIINDMATDCLATALSLDNLMVALDSNIQHGDVEAVQTLRKAARELREIATGIEEAVFND